MNEENVTTWTWEDIAIRKSLSARSTCRDPLGRWPDADNADYRAMLAREMCSRKFADCYERPAQYVVRRARAEITATLSVVG